ncbi:MAG TPA: hypothetical protein VJ806_09985 [Luteimonas sp.]|nr:hypothetical protein [Luteimonas sp.]
MKFELICAAKRPAAAEICYRRKQACYARFGAGSASVPLSPQAVSEDLHLVTATDCATGEIVGSVSIYRRRPGMRLPIEHAIGHYPSMRSETVRWEGRRIAEMSGLWAEEVWRKTGLSEQLLHIAMAACHVLDAEKIVAFGHQHLLGFYEKVGLLPDRSLGHFDYPDPSYVSTVMWADPLAFLTVPEHKRKAVLGFAHAIVAGTPILWRSLQQRFAAAP